MRIAGGVILGYIVMFAVVFVTFSGAFALLGVERSFQPSSYQVTMLWVVVSIVLSLFAAVAGGLTCAIVSRSAWGPKALAIVVVVLGLALAVPVITAPPSTATRGPEVGNTEAMMNARQPVWLALINPLIGAVGVLFGARFRRER